MSIEKTYLQEVAKTILSQLNMRKMEVWAWGSKEFYYIEREVEGARHPALMFSIRTPKVRRGGRVIISLNEGADEYIVEAVRIFKETEKPLGKKTGVHFPELHSVINSLIEDKETYTLACF